MDEDFLGYLIGALLIAIGRFGTMQHRLLIGGLTVNAHPDIAKPLKGFDSVLELALRHRGDAFRVIYALQLDDDIWIVHAFQKKSKSGIKTPKAEIDLIRERLKRLKEMLR